MRILKRLVWSTLRSFGYSIRRVAKDDIFTAPLIDVLDLLIRHETARHPDWFFVQIGAHDGTSFDPIHDYIHKHHWRGILVEPQPKVFARLRKTYETEPQLILENAAIARQDGTATLYALKETPGMPYHATMLASFNRDAVEFNGHGYKGEVEELKVPALTVKSLLAKHQVNRVDLLQIDTEGFDVEIIKMFAEANCWPAIIHFENPTGLSSKLQQDLTPLIQKGYVFHHYDIDTIAYLQSDQSGFTLRTRASQGDLEALKAPPSAE
jgi:FkbM family methyltransferase